MPTRIDSEIANPGLMRGAALFAALIALAICVAPPPASAASTSPGELFAFGYNYYGQLGNATNNGTGNANPTPVPVSLAGATGPVIQVAAGYEHSMALTSAGQLYGFGSNYNGELGRKASSSPNPTPVPIGLPGATGPVTQVAGGGEHSLALTSTGQLYTFGYNYSGQLGTATNSGTTEPVPTPAPVILPGATGPVTQVAGGEYHSLALTSTGQLYTFGSNQYGQLGRVSATESVPTPAPVGLPGATGPVTQIAGGGYHSLALTSTGQLYAFGDNYYGQLGSATHNGLHQANPTPVPVGLPGATGPVTQVAGGYWHSLALTSSGQLYAFGENKYGQLGNTGNNGTSSPNPNPAPISLPGATGPVVWIAAGSAHSLALTSTGQLFAFGSNRYGQLGNANNNGTSNPNPTPTLVDLGAGTTIDTMVSGADADHTLVVVANLAVANSSLPNGRVGAPYGATATAVGGTAPHSWQASGLPAGLSIDAASGQIRGTPTAAGTGLVTLGVRDRYGIAAQSAPIALSIEPRPRAARLAISKLRQSHRRWRRGRRLAKVSSVARRRRGRHAPRGTTFTFKLNRRARVRFAFARLRKVGRGKRKRFRKAGALVFAGHRGGNRVVFQGRISRRKRLKPGRYRLTATARRGKARSKPRSLRFRIVR